MCEVGKNSKSRIIAKPPVPAVRENILEHYVYEVKLS